eukprot:Lithocolla_globosa_v1_NODE_3464_length_1662_cov_34.270068.p2 type:complete len:125 gc:universal NODE_3464_length_1662_cov_34.270068:843-469(-)
MSPPKSSRRRLSIPFSAPHNPPYLSQSKPMVLRLPSAQTSPSVQSIGKESILYMSYLMIRERRESRSTLSKEPMLTYIQRYSLSNNRLCLLCPPVGRLTTNSSPSPKLVRDWYFHRKIWVPVLA